MSTATGVMPGRDKSKAIRKPGDLLSSSNHHSSEGRIG
ncbi:hypothetical protein SD77_3880 [Bacillus badius]|uniref:Ribose 5-phosphate isomerase B n=1 Tax=Bacillus badius TaxID=1455 RepID=A0ABR5AWH8_BACBA|nr:hypothetical protein SD78_1683 [Bacillus badius]KIL79079.1 hypothetical protein SD77_3880 [Bacillus badius]